MSRQADQAQTWTLCRPGEIESSDSGVDSGSGTQHSGEHSSSGDAPGERGDGSSLWAVDASGTTAMSAAALQYAYRLSGRPEEKPRVVIKTDLLPAFSAASIVAMMGAPLGWLWSRLAPPQRSVLTPESTWSPSLAESFHQFDGMALFMLLSFGMGLVVGSVLWLVRSRRGPVLLVAGVVGAAVASWIGMTMGSSFAAGLYPLPPTAQVGEAVLQAPELTNLWLIIVQPLAVALVYGLAASWSSLDDLGRRLR